MIHFVPISSKNVSKYKISTLAIDVNQFLYRNAYSFQFSDLYHHTQCMYNNSLIRMIHMSFYFFITLLEY